MNHGSWCRADQVLSLDTLRSGWSEVNSFVGLAKKRWRGWGDGCITVPVLTALLLCMFPLDVFSNSVCCPIMIVPQIASTITHYNLSTYSPVV